MNTGDTNTSTPVTPVNPGENERTRISSSSFISLASASKLAPTISEGGRKFVQELREEFLNDNKFAVVSVVTGSAEGIIVYSHADKYGILIIFQSVAIGTSPVSDRAGELIAQFRANMEVNDVRIIKSFVIDDYTLTDSLPAAKKMAVLITNTINTAVNEDQGRITGASFGDQGLVVATRQDLYRAYIQRVSPFKVPERDDIGFILGYPKPTCPAAERFNITPETHDIVCAVTGYTQFLRQDTSLYQPGVVRPVQPIIHINSIVSTVPSLVHLPLVLACACATFIGRRTWMNPYMVVNGKEPMNIGNLDITSDMNTAQPQFIECQSPAQASAVINKICNEPCLALDIVDGRSMLLGLECILPTPDSKNKSAILGILQRYYPMIQHNPNMEIIATQAYREFTGQVKIDAQMFDSQYADYLHLMKSLNDFVYASQFLRPLQNPAAHIQQLMDHFPISILYSSVTAILTRAFIDACVGVSPKFSVDLNDDARYNVSFNGIDAAAGLSSIMMTPLQGPNNSYGYNGFTNRY